MKKSIFLFLPFLLFLIGVFVSCEEVKETSIYANWQQRNETFIDSIKLETGDKYVATAEQVSAMPEGELFAVLVPTVGVGASSYYVYCKKLKANTTGEFPLYTSIVSTFYMGTYITGDKFDGCFDGYSATDRNIPISLQKEPTLFDSPRTFNVDGVVPGWIWALQLMRIGERWMLYLPWQCAYGASDYTPPYSSATIPGHSALTFDVILQDILSE